MDAEANVREQLTPMQARNQEIVDAQMLRLVELQRELERTSAEAERPHAAERIVPEPSGGAQSQPRPVEAKRNHLTPEFHVLDAAVAGSPPVPAWERIA